MEGIANNKRCLQCVTSDSHPQANDAFRLHRMAAGDSDFRFRSALELSFPYIWG